MAWDKQQRGRLKALAADAGLKMEKQNAQDEDEIVLQEAFQDNRFG
ncbi:hypothetical protein [Hoeflea sp. TYP-13]